MYRYQALDERSLLTEPKFGHVVGESRIKQLNSEFKSTDYDVRCFHQPYNAALSQSSPSASTTSRTKDASVSNYQIISFLRNNIS